MSGEKHATNQRERWMWLGVISLSLIIISLWGYALFISAKNVNLRRTSEGQLIENTKKNWDTIFIETKTEAKKKQSLKQIKQLLGQLAASPTTTPTDDISATTTIITTTTTATTTKL